MFDKVNPRREIDPLFNSQHSKRDESALGYENRFGIKYSDAWSVSAAGEAPQFYRKSIKAPPDRRKEGRKVGSH